jgi:hypothetical protein
MGHYVESGADLSRLLAILSDGACHVTPAHLTIAAKRTQPPRGAARKAFNANLDGARFPEVVEQLTESSCVLSQN